MIRYANIRWELLRALKQQARCIAYVQALLETLPGAEHGHGALSDPRCQRAILRELLLFCVKFGALPQGHAHTLFLEWSYRLAATAPPSGGHPLLQSGDTVVEEVIAEVIKLATAA